jgi:hypothetical protein
VGGGATRRWAVVILAETATNGQKHEGHSILIGNSNELEAKGDIEYPRYSKCGRIDPTISIIHLKNLFFEPLQQKGNVQII